MTTKKTAGTKAKRAAATRSKVSTGVKRAVKRERVQMVKPSPSAPTLPLPSEADTSLAMRAPMALEKAAPMALATAEQTTARIERRDLEQLIRVEAYKRAQARHFRGGNPAQDWFAAEAAVKAALQARGVQLPV